MKVKDIVNVTSDKYIAITGSEGYAEILEKEQIIHDYGDAEIVRISAWVDDDNNSTPIMLIEI